MNGGGADLRDILTAASPKLAKLRFESIQMRLQICLKDLRGESCARKNILAQTIQINQPLL